MSKYSSITGVANAAIGAHRAVVINTAVQDGVKVPAAASNEVLGITEYETTASGQTVSVQIEGMAEVIATSAVAVGDSVKVDTAGGIVATTTATDKCIGIVRRAAGAGEQALILLKRFTYS